MTTTAITEYSATEAGLAELRERFTGAKFDCSTADGLRAAKAARLELVKLRTSLEAMRVEIKAPALERCRLIDAEAKRITGELLALETPIDAQIKAEEARKEAERKAREEAERMRVENIRARIARINSEPVRLAGKSAAEISERLGALRQAKLDPANYDEFIDEAEAALAAVFAQIEELHLRQVAHEAEQARIIAEREELARLRAAEEARLAAERKAAEEAAAAERARLAAEREQQERELAEQRAAAEAEAAAERARLDEERRQMEEAHAAAMAAIQKPEPVQIKVEPVQIKVENKADPGVIEKLVEAVAAREARAALVEGSQPVPRNATAVIDGQIASVRIEAGTPPELVIEDDTDRVAILLTGDILERIVDALVAWDDAQ